MLAGMAILLVTMGCEKQMGFVAPEEGDVDIAATSTLPIQYNPGGSWFTYFYYMPGDGTAGSPAEYAMSVGNDDGSSGCFVKVWDDGGSPPNITVQYNTAPDWWLTQVHVDIGTAHDSLAHNKPGNLQPGQFRFPPKNEFNLDPYVQQHDVMCGAQPSWYAGTGPWTDGDPGYDPDKGLLICAHSIVCQWDDTLGWVNFQTGTGADTGKPYKDVSLPEDPVHICLSGWPGVQWDWSFFMAAVSGIGPYPSGYNIWDGNWRGWCADAYTDITVPWCEDFYLTSSLGPIPPPYNPDPVVWHRVNYMLNNRLPDWEHNMWDFQTAVWALMGPIRPGLELSANAQAMYDDAMANGGDFMPGPGQQVAVFAVPIDGYDEGEQPFFIQVDP